MIDLQTLTGQTDQHLASFGKHRLRPEAKAAFLAMQKKAQKAGFNLQPASTFRDFERQQTIWNDKFNGLRPVLDQNSRPLDVSVLSTERLCHAILHWSALPGASRHHWGTDLDVYDPDLLPENQRLRLEPWEYEEGGYFYPLSQWLSENMTDFDFYRPFQQSDCGVAAEPWHLSYRPLARLLESQLTPDALRVAWQGKDIAGAEWLTQHLESIFERYIRGGRN